MEEKSYWQAWLGVATVGVIVLSLWLVFNRPPSPEVKEEIPPSSEITNAVLREFDNQGRLIWEIEAERGKYRQDRRIADIVRVRGKFYEDGKVIIVAQGDAGVINQATQEIQIKGNVRGTILKDKIDISANELLWNPDRDLLRGRGKITLEKKADRLKISGEELSGSPKQNRYTLKQNVVAVAGKLGKQESQSDHPLVTVTSEAVTWDVQAQKITTDTPIQGVQQPDPDRPEQRTITATGGTWDTKKQLVELKGEVTGKDEKLDIELTTDLVQWDLEGEKVTLPNPFVVNSPSRALTITAQTGTALLQGEKVNLRGSVQAELRTDQAIVRAEEVEWVIPSQIVTAKGNILYTRRANNLTVRGDQAIANLGQETVQVIGKDVITEFTF